MLLCRRMFRLQRFAFRSSSAAVFILFFAVNPSLPPSAGIAAQPPRLSDPPGFQGETDPPTVGAAPKPKPTPAGPISMTESGLLQILSPDTAQTYAGGVTTRFLLNWDSRGQVLRAFVTFTNSPYQDTQTPRREEQFSFRFPGVTLDPATGVFSARDPAGNLIPVAVKVRRRGGFFSRSNPIEPTAGATIYVTKISGRVAVRLTAKPDAPPTADKTNHWVIDGQVGIL